MKVLLTNDDGISAPGLSALRSCLAKDHQVAVVAPDTERSAMAHAITLTKPLRATKVSLEGTVSAYSVKGTPADCVKLALLELLDLRPDLVISGINPGPNVGFNLNYSGTVSAAKEATLLGYRAIAVSICNDELSHFDVAASFVKSLAEVVIRKSLPLGTFLNVNMPDFTNGDIQGIRICRQGQAGLEEVFHKRKDPRNQTYYWQGTETHLFGDDPYEDGVAIREGYVAITPVKCDMTDHDFLKDLEDWEFRIP